MERNKRLEALRTSNEESNHITKESIQTALIYLMNKKNINDITITELVNRSGVSRSAFYHNYSSKEEILLDFSSNVIELIKSSLEVDEYKNNPIEWFTFLFSQIKLHKKMFELLYKANISNISTYFFGVREFNSSEEEYAYSGLITGLDQVIRCWFLNGMKEPIEDMAILCHKIFSSVEILFK